MIPAADWNNWLAPIYYLVSQVLGGLAKSAPFVEVWLCQASQTMVNHMVYANMPHVCFWQIILSSCHTQLPQSVTSALESQSRTGAFVIFTLLEVIYLLEEEKDRPGWRIGTICVPKTFSKLQAGLPPRGAWRDHSLYQIWKQKTWRRLEGLQFRFPEKQK